MPTILLVDDDRTMVGLLRSLLKLDGFDTIDGAGGAQLLETARARKPDVILMDVFLAGQDGTALLTRLKRDPALAARAAEHPLIGNSWRKKLLAVNK